MISSHVHDISLDSGLNTYIYKCIYTYIYIYIMKHIYTQSPPGKTLRVISFLSWICFRLLPKKQKYTEIPPCRISTWWVHQFEKLCTNRFMQWSKSKLSSLPRQIPRLWRLYLGRAREKTWLDHKNWGNSRPKDYFRNPSEDSCSFNLFRPLKKDQRRCWYSGRDVRWFSHQNQGWELNDTCQSIFKTCQLWQPLEVEMGSHIWLPEGI